MLKPDSWKTVGAYLDQALDMEPPERDAWLACMAQAMTDCNVPGKLRDALMAALFNTADWMRNKQG